jgi:myo-inositol 2-dehydrogenase/D-chiro-inositol 1-dehydrogenase
VGSALVDPAIGEAGDVDTPLPCLTTASGRICQISNSRRATYGYDQRIEVHGARPAARQEPAENNVEIATERGFPLGARRSISSLSATPGPILPR